MNPLDLILWALAILVVAVVAFFLIALVVALVRTVIKPKASSKTTDILGGGS